MVDPADVDAFRAFERRGWEALPGRYAAAFAALTSQAVDALLDAADVRRGRDVLDVATGPGHVAAAARDRGARVIGLDFAPSMVAEARRAHPGIEFREGDAEALPFPDASFHAVVNNFGLLHLGRPERALTEASRVLRPGGRVAFTTWAGPDEAVAFGIVHAAIDRYGRRDVPLPVGPPFFRFSDPEECRRVLRAAGFVEPEVARVPQTWRLPAAETLYEIMAESTVRTAALLRAQTAEAREAIRTAVGAAASRHRRGAGIELPMPAVLASARKP
ncbi:MAG TPA: methyltransferase domain-containing protein [Methylomirabilota bacterium]|nr:methyltransferase domain-containing protein [Methylomirabilota bacterium]